jgi:glycosyltransferase involved in cell wall biosynthesis
MSDPGRLRVAHIELGEHLYGGAQQVLYLLTALPQQEVDSLLICPRNSAVGQGARRLGIEVEEIDYRGDLDWRAASRIRRILARQQVGLVHVHSRRGADIWGALAARALRLPCILSRRVDHHERRWAVALKYRLYHHAIAISEGIRNVMISDGVSAETVTCVRSAVDWERFQQPAERSALALRFGLPDHAVIIGIAAQLIPRKGHDILLDAMAELVARWPDLHLLVMGKGPLESVLKKQIRDRDLGQHIHCVGFLSDLESVLPSLAFLVHPARTEGLGVVLLQAASAGTAVIASDAGGMPEAVTDGETGVLIPPGDAKALELAMERLLLAPAQAAAFGQAGRARMLREFSIPVMAQGNLEVYRKVTAARSAG